MVLSDTAQHPAVFARHPDWQAAFDIDGDAAVATRKKLFDRAAADRMLVTGYHFPFPACGHLIKTASGYEHVPVRVAADAVAPAQKDRRPAFAAGLPDPAAFVRLLFARRHACAAPAGDDLWSDLRAKRLST